MSLLKLEASVREAADREELGYLIVNETRKLTRSRQVFLVDLASHNPVVRAISSLAAVDRNAPMLQWIERLVARLSEAAGLAERKEFALPSFCEPGDATAAAYPFRDLLWLPLRDRDGRPFAGLLLAREIAWSERDTVVADRLAGAYAHAWLALGRARPLLSRLVPDRKLKLAIVLALLAAMAWRVPLTTLAPMEVTAQDPFVVAAPIDGVIEAIEVEPNSPVSAGATLVRFSDTNARNRYEIAEREVLVAEARLKKATQLSFADPRGRQELGVDRAELRLRIAERDFARDLLDKSTLTAPRDGIAVFADKKDLIGRPVSVGERIMEIADAGRIQVSIDLPIGDSLLLRPGARIKVFLDSDPLVPREARLVRSDYQARVSQGSSMVYRLVAELDAAGPPPRLGTRGTAQLYGDDVSVAFYLFRRPITALRQWLGV